MSTIPPLPPSIADPNSGKKKRRPAGTPDPEAEVVSLSPRTLLESDRYVCEICKQGFPRNQNLQMHLRRHKMPWKLMRTNSQAAAAAAAAASSKKKVFVCPEQSCLHHDPCHALGDLVGIKKHFRRKHCENRQWACSRCSKAYAVQSDYKAHVKTCGTRGHSCDCGRVFSRVEAFVEHQDKCRPETRRPPEPAGTTSQTQWTLAPPRQPLRKQPSLSFSPPPSPVAVADVTTELHLSIGPPRGIEKDETVFTKSDVEVAKKELAVARRMRRQAQAEFERACALRAATGRQIDSMLLQITCSNCRKGMPN